MSDLLERIRSRGYWDIRVTPSEFHAERLPRLADLERAFREAHVQLRGWDYPHNPKDGTTRGPDYIEGMIDWTHYLEFWRLYKSGQFVHLFGMREDWYKEGGLSGLNIEPGTILSLGSTLYTMTEIFLFASRLTEAFPLGPNVDIRLRLHGLSNRQLDTMDPGRIPLDEFRRASASTREFARGLSVPAGELIARANEFAVDQTLALYEVFNWDPARQSVVEEQRKFLERRI